MKRIVALVLVMLLVFLCSAALAQRVECPVGGFSLTIPDHFSEGPVSPGSDLWFSWRGNKLTVQVYVSYQGEVSLSDLFVVLTGNETEDRFVKINGMDMRLIRSEDPGSICVSYTWMDRGNSVTMEFTWSPDDPSVSSTVNSIINSISFDAGH